jgi:hypothetical protein
MSYAFITLVHLPADQRAAVRRAYRFLRTSGDAQSPSAFTRRDARWRIARTIGTW